VKYLGGKYRVAKDISEYINSIMVNGQSYWEPFVGAAWILSRVRAHERFASDINPYLISMWNALLEGWTPPTIVTEEEYNAIKDDKDNYPPELVAFVGFALSWGGKWFGGYARDNIGFNYALGGYRSLMKILDSLIGTQFFVADFMTTDPPRENMLIYCDPPYVNTTKYDYCPTFDHDSFWERVRYLDADGHTVIVSEYDAPSDFTSVLEMSTTTGLRVAGEGNVTRQERVFALTAVKRKVEQLTMW